MTPINNSVQKLYVSPNLLSRFLIRKFLTYVVNFILDLSIVIDR